MAGKSRLFAWRRNMIIDHDHEEYRAKWEKIGTGKYNGAFYYSKEIVKNIIPNVETDYNWITILVPGVALDHSIVFVHNNLHPEYYDFLAGCKDLILVCGIKETCEKVKHLGKTIYLPLSIDVGYVKQFARPKTKGTAYVGRKEKTRFGTLPKGIDYIHGLKREDMLPVMAEYENVYAVGRTAIEAKALGCIVLPFDRRYPDPELWKVIDNKDAARMLQKEIDRIGR